MSPPSDVSVVFLRKKKKVAQFDTTQEKKDEMETSPRCQSDDETERQEEGRFIFLDLLLCVSAGNFSFPDLRSRKAIISRASPLSSSTFVNIPLQCV